MFLSHSTRLSVKILVSIPHRGIPVYTFETESASRRSLKQKVLPSNPDYTTHGTFFPFPGWYLKTKYVIWILVLNIKKKLV